jgi:hypothetical protein
MLLGLAFLSGWSQITKGAAVRCSSFSSSQLPLANNLGRYLPDCYVNAHTRTHRTHTRTRTRTRTHTFTTLKALPLRAQQRQATTTTLTLTVAVSERSRETLASSDVPLALHKVLTSGSTPSLCATRPHTSGWEALCTVLVFVCRGLLSKISVVTELMVSRLLLGLERTCDPIASSGPCTMDSSTSLERTCDPIAGLLGSLHHGFLHQPRAYM